MKLSGGGWLGDHGWNEKMKVTQRQFNFIYDYIMFHDRNWNPDKYEVR